MKKILTVLALTLFVGILTGCSQSEKLDINYTCSKDYNGETLNFLNWGEYIEPKLIIEFEKRCNAKVIVDVVVSNELFKAEIEKGINNPSLPQYDLATPSDYMVEYLIESNNLLPLDFENIPNIVNIDEKYLGKSYDTENNYSVPYFWGTLGIMYNKDVLGRLGINETEVDSWSDLFNIGKDSKLYQKVYMYDTLRDLYMTALFSLGYDINTTNINEITLATNLLKSQTDSLSGYGTDEIKTLIAGGNLAAGVVMNGDYLSIVFSEDVNVGFILPEEGTNIWFDNFIIPKSAQNKKLAEEFINFMLDAKVSYYNAKYVGYSSPNKEALELLKQEDRYRDFVNSPAYNPTQSYIEKSAVYQDLSDVYVTINGEEMKFYAFLQEQYYQIKK